MTVFVSKSVAARVRHRLSSEALKWLFNDYARHWSGQDRRVDQLAIFPISLSLVPCGTISYPRLTSLSLSSWSLCRSDADTETDIGADAISATAHQARPSHPNSFFIFASCPKLTAGGCSVVRLS